YSSNTSSIRTLSVLPPVSWCCRLDCTSSKLVHATAGPAHVLHPSRGIPSPLSSIGHECLHVQV
ncbi:hypothetical protein GOODEAATRI_028639, partial [Goodea atripinnis]